MLIAFPIFLLLLFAAVFWVIRDSKQIWLRVLIISGFFSFCVTLAMSLDSIMGWSAHPRSMPETVTLLSVSIREPNKALQIPGNIYLMIEHPPTRHNLFLRTFGYNAIVAEPRLFKLPYSRELHEELQKNVIPRLQAGQKVTGKLSKGKGKGDGKGEPGDGEPGDGKGRGGKGKGKGQKGGGSDSLEVPWVFHVLPPSAFLRKDQ